MKRYSLLFVACTLVLLLLFFTGCQKQVTRDELKTMIRNGEDVTHVDTSKITDMSALFRNNHSFNQDISGWDVSNVTTMENMFNYASSFNQDISSWDVSKVKDMSTIFFMADRFNQDISGWDVSNVVDMEGMFLGATSFNQDISGWDVSSVTNMQSMFEFARAFKQDLSAWDVGNVTRHDKFSSSSKMTSEPRWSNSKDTGLLGPAGGLVFYENPDWKLDGWRYLEAAPAGWNGSAEDPRYMFGYYRPESTNLLVGTETSLGSGKKNTELLVSAMKNAAYSAENGSAPTSQYAAKICDDYSITVKGVVYDDWFLPSRYELDQIRQNLIYRKNLGEFSDGIYWSSSEFNVETAWYSDFPIGSQNSIKRGSGARVRPVRAF